MRRRKQTSRGTWNIYVLEKKPVVGMYKQFVSFLYTIGSLSLIVPGGVYYQSW